MGVYFKTGSKDWEKLGQSLPNVIVSDIDINYTEKKLVAATFGRGLWHVDISDVITGDEKITATDEMLSIYPNPVEDGRLNFKLDKNYTNFNYKIYNVVGGVVSEGHQNSNTGAINVSKLVAGTYMFKAYKKEVHLPAIKFIIN